MRRSNGSVQRNPSRVSEIQSRATRNFSRRRLVPRSLCERQASALSPAGGFRAQRRGRAEVWSLSEIGRLLRTRSLRDRQEWNHHVELLLTSRRKPRRRRDTSSPRELAEIGEFYEHTSELQSHLNLVCRLLLEKKKRKT